MPFATFIKVREVSSEDNVHLAENLIINSQATKKWKTKNVGEKSAYVILEMSESNQIVGIDIGNEHSAFVEVLVGKSTCAPEDFKEILLTCSFMTPIESKSSNNINRVRCFSKEALVPNVVDNKWTLVKIVCTQPFNKHVQYGLSFVKLHVQENQKPKEIETDRTLVTEKSLSRIDNTKASRDKPANNVTKLKFREDSPESEADDSTSLFSRWKKFKDEKRSVPSVSTDTVFSNAQSINSQLDKAGPSIRDRNRDELAFGDENLDKCNTQDRLERLCKLIENDKEKRRLETEKSSKNKDYKKFEIPSSSKSDETTDSCKNFKRTKKPESPHSEKIKKLKTATKFAPFNQLLRGVVLVISGIQNPERSDLRNKALAMGAKYKGDWDSTCTHLICAFKNTPKYNQVRGKGKIVSPSWINKCYSLKKYWPWRRYALDSNDLGKPESDEEIIVEPLQFQTEKIDSNKENTSAIESNCKNDALEIYDIDDSQKNNALMPAGEVSSDSDTDDEIKRVKESLKNNKRDIYDASTDEDDYLKEKYSQM